MHVLDFPALLKPIKCCLSNKQFIPKLYCSFLIMKIGLTDTELSLLNSSKIQCSY